MKSIISFVAVAALSFIASAGAQEESPSPATEEKASATVEESPAAAATEAATAVPAAEKSPAAAAERAASPVEVKKATAPAAAKAASPAAAPAMATKPAKNMSVEATLKDNENRWEAAIAKHDIASIESMVANDFIGVSSKGKVQSHRGLLGEMKSDKDTYTSTRNEKLDVHRYGNDVAVVIGTAREKGTGKDRKAFDRTYRFTDTWMNRGGKWQCIASQSSLLSQK
ncbi:MAG TPA: nuclear transport factor 2 family protein [Chthoniobacterales bacterium]|nr:nuclear transport factor 2 family protein [Chthoniobacterales bacterium]